MDEPNCGSYAIQNRVLVAPTSSSSSSLLSNNNSNANNQRNDSSSLYNNYDIQTEAIIAWKETNFVPLSKRVQKLTQLYPQIQRIMIQSFSSASNSFPNSILDFIPKLQSNTKNNNGNSLEIHKNENVASSHGPSGVAVSIEINQNLQHVIMNQSHNNNDNYFYLSLLQDIVHELTREKWIVVPISKDALEGASNGNGNKDNNNNSNILSFQFILPLNGAAVSADAIQSSFVTLVNNKDDLYQNAAKLSELLLNVGSTPNQSQRGMWVELTKHTSSTNDNNDHHPNNDNGHRCKDYWTLARGMKFSLTTPSELSQYLSNIDDSAAAAATTTTVMQVQGSFTKNNDNNYYLKNNYVLVPFNHQDPLTSFIKVDYNLKPYWKVSKNVGRPKGVSNRGTIETILTNNHYDCVAQITLHDELPEFISPIWQSWKLEYNHKNKQTSNENDITNNDNINNNNDNIKPNLVWNSNGSVSIKLNSILLEPQSALHLSIDYEPVFWAFQKFPGDPNRGMELPPAQVTWQCLSQQQQQEEALPPVIKLYSESALILPPLPDMSMPFNVISLSCSLYAYLIGSLIALLVKKSSERIRYKLHPDQKPKSKLIQIKEKIKTKLQFIFKSKSSESSESNDNNNNNAPGQTTTAPPAPLATKEHAD